jgi:hypothetical protein
MAEVRNAVAAASLALAAARQWQPAWPWQQRGVSGGSSMTGSAEAAAIDANTLFHCGAAG